MFLCWYDQYISRKTVRLPVVRLSFPRVVCPSRHGFLLTMTSSIGVVFMGRSDHTHRGISPSLCEKCRGFFNSPSIGSTEIRRLAERLHVATQGRDQTEPNFPNQTSDFVCGHCLLTELSLVGGVLDLFLSLFYWNLN